MKCGLLGSKLQHSYSPEIHKYFGDYDYSLFELEPEALPCFLKEKAFHGINVTIPYKKAVIPYCDRLTEVAHKLGAVNTIIRNTDGALIGHNTDYYGFQSMVEHSKLIPTGKKVLVLGSGGASNTVCTVLQELGAQVVVISRHGTNHYGNLHLHRDAAIIVNTTPVGMYPKNGEAPLSLNNFPQLEGVLDLIYNPGRTQLLIEAEERKLITENGLWMLIAQAKESAELFTNSKIPDSKIQVIYDCLHKRMGNLILIGMPGCGKSTIGRIVAQKTGREFIDADTCLENRAGIPIPDFLRQYGEESFRRLETSVLAELGKQSGKILATGGGCVTKQENYSHLHQNGTILWLKRPLQQLPTEGRPLSQATSAEEMYQIRQPLYQAFCDYQFENCEIPETVADKIIHLLGLETVL